MQITVNITEIAGPKLADLRVSGELPEQLGGRKFHVTNPSGSRVVVRYADNGALIAGGNGWSNAMQALADNYGAYGAQVTVAFLVPSTSTPLVRRIQGTWTPGTRKQAKATDPADVMQAECQEIPARDLQPGMLAELVPGEWVEVLQVEQGQRVSVTFNDEPRRRFQRHHDDLVRIADPASIRLTKAQERFLRAVGQKRVSYYRGNREWAASHAKRGPMFKELMDTSKFSNRTPSGVAVDILGLIAYNHHESGFVRLSGPGATWLAAHPA